MAVGLSLAEVWAQLVSVEQPEAEESRPAVARTYAEVFALARQTGYPVYSDDRFPLDAF